MTRAAKTATQVREEAYRLARIYAKERAKDGDPEGAGVISDLARAIRMIRLTQESR